MLVGRQARTKQVGCWVVVGLHDATFSGSVRGVGCAEAGLRAIAAVRALLLVAVLVDAAARPLLADQRAGHRVEPAPALCCVVCADQERQHESLENLHENDNAVRTTASTMGCGQSNTVETRKAKVVIMHSASCTCRTSCCDIVVMHCHRPWYHSAISWRVASYTLSPNSEIPV